MLDKSVVALIPEAVTLVDIKDGLYIDLIFKDSKQNMLIKLGNLHAEHLATKLESYRQKKLISIEYGE